MLKEKIFLKINKKSLYTIAISNYNVFSEKNLESTGMILFLNKIKIF